MEYINLDYTLAEILESRFIGGILPLGITDTFKTWVLACRELQKKTGLEPVEIRDGDKPIYEFGKLGTKDKSWIDFAKYDSPSNLNVTFSGSVTVLSSTIKMLGMSVPTGIDSIKDPVKVFHIKDGSYVRFYRDKSGEYYFLIVPVRAIISKVKVPADYLMEELEHKITPTFEDFCLAYDELRVLAEKVQESWDSGTNLLQEGFFTGLVGATVGTLFGPKIGRAICKVLGITAGPLYDILTSRMVAAAIGAVLTDGSSKDPRTTVAKK